MGAEPEVQIKHKMGRERKRMLLRAVAGSSTLAILAGTAPVAHAQTVGAALAQAQAAPPPVENPASPETGDIIVTAQKRSSSLQKVPFSISATTEAQIRNSGSASIADLARNVAGLTIADLGPGQSTVSIRGVSSGQVVRDESSRKETVGIYLDESAISSALFTPDLDFFDLNRVEVLRGPQGTLFGSGSEGGTLRYISNTPNLTKVEGSLEATGGLVDHGSAQYAGKALLNIPIIEGKAAIRAVGYYDHFGGFIDAITPSGAIEQNVNDGKRYGGRLAVTLAPTATLTITPRVTYQKLETNGFPRADVANFFRNPYTTVRTPGTFGPYQQYRQTPEGLTDSFLLVDNTINWDIGAVTATSISSYIHRRIEVLRDAAQGVDQITGVLIGIPGTTTLNAPLNDRTKYHSFSQELRLASNGNSPFRWVVGGYYVDQRKKYGQTITNPGFASLFNTVTGAGLDGRAGAPLTSDINVIYASDFDIHTRQYAAFGEASYDITDRLTATGGLRYYNFKEDRVAIQTGFLNCGNSLTDCATPANLSSANTKSNGFNPRGIISYKVAPTVTVDAQASRGFRLGGINDPLVTGICGDDIAALGGRDIRQFGDEHVWNYELGAKTQTADRRVTFNVAAYYIDIRDLQVSARLRCSSTIIVNVPKSRTIGFEAEFSARPTDSFSFGVNFSYNDSKVQQGVNIPDGTGGPDLIQKGDRLPTSPKYQISTNAAFETPVSVGYKAFINGVIQFQSDSYSFLADQRNGGTLQFPVRFGRTTPLNISFPTKLQPYALGNLRFGVRMEKSWEAAVFVNNIWNERAELALDRERGGEGRVSYLVNQPRTIGIDLRYNF